MPLDWSEIREHFPALSEITYLNTASVGLLSRETISTVMWFISERKYGGLKWREWYRVIDDELRGRVARLINADPMEIGFVQNTSMGLNIIANSIKWERGQNIVLTDLEFPTNLFPWQVIAKRYRLEIRYVKNRNGILRLEDFVANVDENTRAIIVSWVEFSNGFVNDLAGLSRLAEEHGSYMIVDGIQGVGVIPLDVRKTKIDFLVSGFQKWLLGIGGGFMFVRREILDELLITFAGWLGDKNPFDFGFREFRPADSARRFELGTPSFCDFLAANSAVSLILEIGIENIHRRALELKGYLIKRTDETTGISIAGPRKSESPITLIKVKNAQKIIGKLIERNIIVSYRAGGIRVSPHFYNNREDIDRLILGLGSKE